MEMEQFYDSNVASEITYTSKNHPRCMKNNGHKNSTEKSALMIFSVFLMVFWIALFFLAYIIFHPEDFVRVKPLKIDQYPLPRSFLPTGEDSSSFRFEKNPKCEHFEYLADFRNAEIFQNIWITLTYCIFGILVSISAFHGVLMNSPYFLDPFAFYLFVYGFYKLFVAVILFLIKCPGEFLLKHVILTDPAMVIMSCLDLRIPAKYIHLIQAVVAVCILRCLTKFRNRMVKKNLKNQNMAKEFVLSAICTSSLNNG